MMLSCGYKPSKRRILNRQGIATGLLLGALPASPVVGVTVGVYDFFHGCWRAVADLYVDPRMLYEGQLIR